MFYWSLCSNVYTLDLGNHLLIIFVSYLIEAQRFLPYSPFWPIGTPDTCFFSDGFTMQSQENLCGTSISVVKIAIAAPKRSLWNIWLGYTTGINNSQATVLNCNHTVFVRRLLNLYTQNTQGCILIRNWFHLNFVSQKVLRLFYLICTCYISLSDKLWNIFANLTLW